ncbi:Fur-regulated basic protein FbpA [Niallia oryzisoli]|uniref:Fur-regulated basic protein FbpA n=1 Tax=Niallia oryzisoli TaxID=1737571 RepID=UPI00373538AD
MQGKEVVKIGNLLRQAVQLKRSRLINKLIKSGVYKKNKQHLYELTLSDLEREYEYIEANGLASNSKVESEK